MLSYFSDLRYREVIDIHTGLRLGYVCDLEFDDTDGRIISLINPRPGKDVRTAWQGGRLCAALELYSAHRQ